MALKLKMLIAAGVLVLLFLNKPLHAADNYLRAEIDEKSGRVEILKAGTREWKMLDRKMTCGNNDKVRVHKNGRLVLVYPDRSRITVRENSLLLINSSEKTVHGNANKLITLHSGTIFFNAKKPFLNYEGHHNRVFCPTMGIVNKSGAFIVAVDKVTLLSRVFVLSGTLEVRGIRSHGSFYLQEGTLIQSDSSGVFSEAEEFENDKLKEEFNWLDGNMLTEEILRGKLIRKRKQDVSSGKSLGKLVVMNFSSAVKSPYHWNVPEFLSSFVAAQYSEVTYRETVRAGSSRGDPVALARAQEADRVVTGRIEDFAVEKKAVLNSDSTKYELQWGVRIHLNVKVLDAVSGKVLKETTYKEELTAKGTKDNDLEKVLKQPLDFRNEVIQKSLLGKALRSLKGKLLKIGRSAI